MYCKVYLKIKWTALLTLGKRKSFDYTIGGIDKVFMYTVGGPKSFQSKSFHFGKI